MRYSGLTGKEIIDVEQGARLGVVNDTDLVIDTEAGTVTAIVVPYRNGPFGRGELVVPWRGIKKIGVDLIIVDLAAIDTGGA